MNRLSYGAIETAGVGDLGSRQSRDRFAGSSSKLIRARLEVSVPRESRKAFIACVRRFRLERYVVLKIFQFKAEPVPHPFDGLRIVVFCQFPRPIP